MVGPSYYQDGTVIQIDEIMEKVGKNETSKISQIFTAKQPHIPAQWLR